MSNNNAFFSVNYCACLQIDRPTQRSGVDFAAEIINETRSLGVVSHNSRSSLVKALSHTLDAGVMDDDAEGFVSGTIAGTLKWLHLISLADLAPGEEQLVTSAPSLALGSQKAACFAGTCLHVQTNAPLLHREDLPSSSKQEQFVLSPQTVAEVVENSICTSDEGQIGLQAVRWRRNPFASRSHQPENAESMAANHSAVGLSITACEREQVVVNLSTPVVMTLALPLRPTRNETFSNTSAHPQMFHGICDRNDPVVVVYCESNQESYTTICPSNDSVRQWQWTITCPKWYSIAKCLYWDGSAWADDGVSALNATIDDGSNVVRCESTHLTTYTSTVEESSTSVVRVMRTYESVRVADFKRAIGLICLLIASYIITLVVTVRNHRSMRKARVLRAKAIWECSDFQATLLKIPERDSPENAQQIATMAVQARRRAAAIEQSTLLALSRVHCTATRVSLKDSFRLYRQALVQQNGLLAFVFGGEPTYEQAPAIFMELLTFLSGVAVMHVRLLFMHEACCFAFDSPQMFVK